LDEAKLFNEITLRKNNLKKYCLPKNKMSEDVWVDIFKVKLIGVDNFSNLKKIVEFFMCIPGTSVSVERVFSRINCLWTDEKNRLKINTVKAMIAVKLFFDETRFEFHNLLSENEKLHK